MRPGKSISAWGWSDDSYATCKLVGQFGNAQFDPALRELIELHDIATHAESSLRLA